MKKAFTLAEVLITLLIIGIVAALTIPSVISNYQQQEFKTGLKKAVSVLNEAIQTNIAQEGETPYENSDMFKYLQRHMSVLKTSQINTCYDNNNQVVKLDDNYAECSSSSDSANLIQNMVFYTTDGMRFEFPVEYLPVNRNFIMHESGINAGVGKIGHKCYSDGNCFENQGSQSGFCGSYGLKNNLNNTKNTPCIIIVDVNGDKKPNPINAYIETKTVKPYPTEDFEVSKVANQPFGYSYPSPTDKKLQDIFTIMITDEKAIPFGVVAQRAMYSK